MKSHRSKKDLLKYFSYFCTHLTSFTPSPEGEGDGGRGQLNVTGKL
jgi:hypothetical protein